MSNRTIRVNELIQRELGDILHRRYQSETVAITITEVRVAPDLRDGLDRIERALTSGAFIPSTAVRTFRIAASDFTRS